MSQKEKKVLTLKNIGFFDSSLKYDFSELRLYHNVNIFVNQISCDQYHEADIVQLFSKCLRGATYMWYQFNLKNADLVKCIKTLIVKFKKESFIQLSFKSVSQITSQQSHQQKYRKYTVCSTLFSSINRLLSHNQMTSCDKSSCNHCEEIFDSKNKLHDYIRSHECQKLLSRFVATSASATKSLPPHNSGLSSLFISETIFNDANTAIKKEEIKFNTHISAAKSRTLHKSNLSTLTSVEISSTPLSAYRFVSPSPSTYEPYKKSYFTIVDLYMRYASLSKPLFIITRISLNKPQARNKVTRIMIVLSVIFMQNLYEKFHNKKKRVIPTSNRILNSPTKQYATR